MSYPINYPTPQGANVQIFTRNTSSGASKSSSWIKPQGASMVWFTLIGSGGNGGTATTDVNGFTAAGGGGGSGAVTNCMVPAFLIPDILTVQVSPNNDTAVLYQQKDGTGYILLEAKSGDNGSSVSTTTGPLNGAGGAGGTASTSNEFSAAGFFQSIEGQTGRAGNVNQTATTTTFLQGGCGGSASQVASQYGYSVDDLTTVNLPGYAMISPILVSVAATYGTRGTSSTLDDAVSGFGSGGSGGYTTGTDDRAFGSRGGSGLVVIVTW